jgi:hypothetical protein
MSRFDTMASISSRLSLGTLINSDCTGVTTPPYGPRVVQNSVHGCGQQLKPGPLLGLDQVLDEPVRLLIIARTNSSLTTTDAPASTSERKSIIFQWATRVSCLCFDM